MESAFFIIIGIIVFCIILIVANSSRETKSPWSLDSVQFWETEKNRKELLETVTKLDRGTSSERNLVLKLLKNRIPSQTIFHDLYLKKQNGHFSQIDLVVATTAGIVVFEVKDYSGWIFGTGYQSQWTQVLAYGKQKYKFYNPIMQNNKHIADLKKQRKQFENIPFYSVVVFDGDCKLRDIKFVPEGTFVVRKERVLEVMRIIQTREPAPYTDKHEVVRVFRKAVENGTCKETEKQHIEKVTDMLGRHRVFD
ncbi:MAG: NERD domain-containing protein [Bacteroidales bacterium]|nr:NERD domain-containing protein [Bacteroidales bacterium]